MLNTSPQNPSLSIQARTKKGLFLFSPTGVSPLTDGSLIHIIVLVTKDPLYHLLITIIIIVYIRKRNLIVCVSPLQVKYVPKEEEE